MDIAFLAGAPLTHGIPFDKPPEGYHPLGQTPGERQAAEGVKREIDRLGFRHQDDCRPRACRCP